MTERYLYKESVFKRMNSKQSGLSLDENSYSALRIFRMLSGTCRIFDEFDSKNISLNKNYFVIPSEDVKGSAKPKIINAFDGVDIDEISDYFKKLSSNDDFYRLIESELINCLVARRAGRCLEAFLFLYRIIEGVSYSIPLMYVSRAKSFNGTYRVLQKFMPKKDNDGELAFFKSFMGSQWNKKYFFDITFDLKMDQIEVEEMKSKYYDIYMEKAGSKIVDSTEDEEIKMSFIQFYDFMIELRNRYFHFLQGSWQKNIKTSQVVYPDLFFRPIIDHAINWVAVVLLEVIKFDIERSDTSPNSGLPDLELDA